MIKKYGIETDELENNALNMFDKLKSHIGEEVSYIGWYGGSKEEGTAVLKLVIDYDKVGLNQTLYPFVGSYFAISTIVSKEGEILYSNPNIENNYNRIDMVDVFASMRLIFGDRIVDKLQAEYKIEIEESKKFKEEHQKKLKIAIDESIKEGIKYIRNDTFNDWLNFVEENSDDFYSFNVVTATLSYIKRIADGISFSYAEDLVFCEACDLNSSQVGFVVKAIAYFSPQGELFKTYWKAKYGDTYDEASIVNPAILRILN